MNLETKTIEELQARKKEIETLSETEESVEVLGQLDEEHRAIIAELEKRANDEQKRAEIRSKIAAGKEGEVKESEVTMGNEKKEINQSTYRSAWLKILMKKELNEEETRTLVDYRAFASNSTYAIPTQIANKVVDCLKKRAVLINEIELFEVVGNLRIPYEVTVNEAAAHTENYQESASADAVGYVDLAGEEIIKILEISKVALSQSEDAFERWLVENLARKLGDKIDDKIAGAFGSGTFTTDTNQIVNTQGPDYDDICDLIALVPAALDNGSKFFMNKATFWDCQKIKDTNKRPILDPERKTLMGYPVVIDDYISKSNSLIYFGNAYEAVKGKIGGMEVEPNEHGSGWEKGLVSYRGYTTFVAKKVGTVGIVRFVTTA